MTNLSAPLPVDGPGPSGSSEPAGTSTPERPQSLLRRLAGDVLVRWGARVGLFWVALLVLLAVLAPVVANSHPFLMKTSDGLVSSPWLLHLSPADWTLFATALVVGVAFLMRRQRPALRIWLVLGVIVVSAVLSNLL